MSISFILFLSLATTGAILLTLSRIIGLKAVIKHGVKIDVVTTILLCFAFAGTFIGMAVAICAGLTMAFVLTCAKAAYKGLERFDVVTPLTKPKPVKPTKPKRFKMPFKIVRT